jgi:hypothetical protein
MTAEAADPMQQSAGCPINVTAYGAVCNGSADDTAAINKTLAVCGGACRAVVVPAGTCMISAPLNIPSNCSLGGAGIGATVIKKKPGAGMHFPSGLIQNADLTHGNSDLAIHDLTLMADGSSFTPYGIYLKSVSRAQIFSVELKDILKDAAAIDIDSSNHFSVRGCMIRNSSKDGIVVSSDHASSSHFIIERNDVAEIQSDDGIFVTMIGAKQPANPSSHFSILRNRVARVKDTAIEVGGLGDGKAQHRFWRVEDNKVYDSPTGILVRDAADGEITHNLVSGCSKQFPRGGAIAVYAGEANVTNVKITDNSVQDYGSASGLLVSFQPRFRPSGLTITGNSFSGGAQGGAAMHFIYCGQSVVKNNTIAMPAGHHAIQLDTWFAKPVQCDVEANPVTLP